MMAAAETIPLAALGQRLQVLAESAAGIDWRPALQQCAIAARADILENFRGQHAPDGTPWPTIQGMRARQGRGSPQALRDLGLLMASATARGPDSVEEITTTSMETGTALSYAATHQEGAVIEPVRGQALAVPVTPEAYRAGTARDFPRPLAVVWPRGAPRGRLVERRGKGQRAKDVTQYLLLPRATIPARPFVGASAALLDRWEEILGGHLEEHLGAS